MSGDPRFNNPVKPKCATCGKLSDVHAAPLHDVIPGTHGGYRWICASCEYLEANPGATRRSRTSGGGVQLTLASDDAARE